MTLRFAVLAHDDPEMLRLLARRLHPYGVWVHLDASVSVRDYLASVGGDMPPNVTFVVDRWTVRWGGYSVVQAMRSAGTAAISSSASGDHVIFLSGRCYPIRPLHELADHLAAAPRQQFARAYRLSNYDRWHTDRYEIRHWFDLAMPKATGPVVRRLVRNGLKHLTRTLPRRRSNLDVVAGSQWMALTPECLSEAFAALDTPAYRVFKNSFAPDEMAIQTFLYNSNWGLDTQVMHPEDLSAMDISSLPNLHFLRPAVSGLASLTDVRAGLSSGAFFVRKLDSRLSADVIRFIDNEISLKSGETHS